MVSGLDDPFAWYLDASEVEESKIDTEAKVRWLRIDYKIRFRKKL